ncbi:Peptidoglycan endopeptidase RipA precursor [Mycobacteroides salmoniphilum]|uniref:Peptidoglycan endopeptidase RipA n=2 Tax=Mycobacteroides salmoniphilum TaxID=404941 RepID=A0A4V3I1F7_9MYCO|nr:Peptidoglycan endopeptidase RipA precursor [Mycobacteroides salmoniphilum]
MGSGGQVSGGSAAPLVRELGPPQVPQTWSSAGAQNLMVRHARLSAAGDVFAAGDDETKQKVDAAGSAVSQGKTQMGAIKDDYKLNRDRLAPGSGNPEIAMKMAQLDRQRAADGASTVRSSMGRIPQIGPVGAMSGFGGSPMGALGSLGSMVPQMMAPISAIGPALLQPLSSMQALMGPATSMLGGLNIPQQVTHQGPPPGTATAALLQPLSSMQALMGPATSMLGGLNIPQQVTHQGPPPGTATATSNGKVNGPASEAGKRIAEYALKQLGLPYVWGGGDQNGPTKGIEGGNQLGFDCSGLVLASVHDGTDIVLPRISENQVNVGMSVNPSDMQAGDCVYFNHGGDWGHAAIAISPTEIVEAPDRNQVVKISTINPSASNVAIRRVA